jgi:hypothetical protein
MNRQLRYRCRVFEPWTKKNTDYALEQAQEEPRTT